MPTLTPLDVFRDVLPRLPPAGLEALAVALEDDDPAIPRATKRRRVLPLVRAEIERRKEHSHV